MKTLFIINPISGKGSKDKLISRLDEMGFEYVVTS